ncbi:hypothetical protein CHS0354_009712 [Potamilus streckersoni]|uniref:Uncharacterized protein n=1 Tax=Potamilus streckersoni TaxID=2493646 RepID=A0AAE0S054_9BIVA|nr:hypothetical protein CHS0354_009712 [Potamilus streckersoni]
MNGPAPKRIKLDNSRKQETIRAYNHQQKLKQLRTSLLTSTRHGTGWSITTVEQEHKLDITEQIIPIAQNTYILPKTPGQTTLFTYSLNSKHSDNQTVSNQPSSIEITNNANTLAHNTLEQNISTVDLGPTRNRRKSIIETPPPTKHIHKTKDYTNIIPSPSHTKQIDEETLFLDSEAQNSQDNLRLNASTIYPWITEFEDYPMGQKEKQPLKGRPKSKNTLHNAVTQTQDISSQCLSPTQEISLTLTQETNQTRIPK